LIDSLKGDSSDSDEVSGLDPLAVYGEEMRFHIDNCDENYAQFGADIIFMEHIATNQDPTHEIVINCKICFDNGFTDIHRESKKVTDSYYVLMSDCNIDTLHSESTIYTDTCPNEENHPDPEIPEESLMDEKILACENGEYTNAADSGIFEYYPIIYEFITESFQAVRQGDCQDGSLYNYIDMIKKTDTLVHNSITDTCDRYELIYKSPLGVVKSCETEVEIEE